MSTRPFFSIGITTYKRPELLRQCLQSVLNQTFSDFEVIIGNDDLTQPLSEELVGISDPRIRVFNNPVNLGEIGNMNSLLEQSRGRYFTWQFDDDLYAPDFLAAVFSTINQADAPACVYTSFGYVWGRSFPNVVPKNRWKSLLLSGRQFLHGYLSGTLPALGCCGVFEVENLRKIGGAKKLCEFSIGAHSEHLIVLEMGSLENVAYVDAPLVLYRNSAESWSYRNKDAELYQQAGAAFLTASFRILAAPHLRQDFKHNFGKVVDQSVDIVVGKLIARDRSLDTPQLRRYLEFVGTEIAKTAEESELRTAALLILRAAARKSRTRQVLKARFKASAPTFCVEWLHMIRAYSSRRR